MISLPAHGHSWTATEDAARGDDMASGAPPAAGAAREEQLEYRLRASGTVGIAVFRVRPELVAQIARSTVEGAPQREGALWPAGWLRKIFPPETEAGCCLARGKDGK